RVYCRMRGSGRVCKIALTHAVLRRGDGWLIRGCRRWSHGRLRTVPYLLTLFTPASSSALHVSDVGAILDLPAHFSPILLKCIVTLHEHLHAKAAGGVADFDAFELPKPSVYRLAGDGRFDPFDPQEILLVQRTKPLEANLEIRQFLIEVLSFQGASYRE